jgi:prevent-host-death family protein
MKGLWMPKTVSSTEAQNNFGAVLQWAEKENDEVIIQRRGKPSAVVMPYTEYEKVVELRQQEKKRQAIEALRAIRERVQSKNKDLTAEEAYQLAGFGLNVINETLQSDATLQNDA